MSDGSNLYRNFAAGAMKRVHRYCLSDAPSFWATKGWIRPFPQKLGKAGRKVAFRPHPQPDARRVKQAFGGGDKARPPMGNDDAHTFDDTLMAARIRSPARLHVAADLG